MYENDTKVIAGGIRYKRRADPQGCATCGAKDDGDGKVCSDIQRQVGPCSGTYSWVKDSGSTAPGTAVICHGVKYVFVQSTGCIGCDLKDAPGCNIIGACAGGIWIKAVSIGKQAKSLSLPEAAKLVVDAWNSQAQFDEFHAAVAALEEVLKK